MAYEPSGRLKQLPPYLFVEQDRLKQEAIARGEDVINLGIGDPDLPTPAPIIGALKRAAENPANHRYPIGRGFKAFREKVTEYYARRFRVSLAPDREILALIGSKEGIGHLPLAFVNPGELVLVPDPGYPPYVSGTVLAGGEPFRLPLSEEHGFLPQLDRVERSVLERARVLFFNYPNNPTSAVANREFFEKIVFYAKKYGFIPCHDAAYVDIAFDGYQPPSFLETPGARDVGIEFYSLSKGFNMTGWRIGVACGNAEVISGLARVKSHLDSGIFGAIQEAGVTAFDLYDEIVPQNVRIYQERRDVLVAGLREQGWQLETPRATFYCWLKTRPGLSSAAMTRKMVTEAAIVATPGRGLGESGEGYVRLALTVPVDRLRTVLDRLQRIRWNE
jgi:LL-diaminopimelate aminotransferase